MYPLAYLQKEVMQWICFVCLFDGMLKRLWIKLHNSFTRADAWPNLKG